MSAFRPYELSILRRVVRMIYNHDKLVELSRHPLMDSAPQAIRLENALYINWIDKKIEAEVAKGPQRSKYDDLWDSPLKEAG